MLKRSIKLFLMICFIVLSFSYTIYADSLAESYDLTNYPDGIIPPEHVHIWVWHYTDSQHWQQCTVCNQKVGIQSHSLVSNGGDKTLYCRWTGTPYQETCYCGYKGKPQFILIGNYEAWKSDVVNVWWTGYRLSELRQISYAEFNSLIPSYPANPNGYSWVDDDGDGLGWVFDNSVVPSSEDGLVVGTIKQILGTEGDFGYHNYASVHAEYYKIGEYLTTQADKSRIGFVNWLSQNEILSTNTLYGLKEKYQYRVTDNQWNKIVASYAIVSGVSAKTYQVCHMVICSPNYRSEGNYNYSSIYNACYDDGKSVDFCDGKAGTCDVCGRTFLGNEDYTLTTYVQESPGYGFKSGIVEVDSTPIIFQNKYNNVLQITTRFRRVSETSIKVSYILQPLRPEYWIEINGVTYPEGQTVTTVEYEAYTEDHFKYNKWGYYTINEAFICTPYGKRALGLGSMYMIPDHWEPTAYGYSGATVNNEYWKAEGNGTETDTSPKVVITCTFYDKLLYTNNTVQVHILDQDMKTPLLQANGTEWVNLVKRSGSDDYWTGSVDVMTEVKGSKYVYVQARDSTNNLSELIPVQVSWVDSAPPSISMSLSPSEGWTQSKTLTINGSDAFDNVNIGLSDDAMLRVSNDTYSFKRVYDFKGDVYGKDKEVMVYSTDGTGNMSSKKILVGKLDNTKPTITSVVSTVGYDTSIVTISQHDKHPSLGEGSGVNQYMFTKSAELPNTGWSSNNNYTVSSPGDYYIWVKDRAENVSLRSSIRVDINYKLNVTCNNGSYSGLSEYTLVSDSTQNSSIPVPTKTGYVFLGWYEGNKQIYDANGVCVAGSDWSSSKEFTGYRNISVVDKWRPVTYEIRVYSNKPLDSIDTLNKKK